MKLIRDCIFCCMVMLCMLPLRLTAQAKDWEEMSDEEKREYMLNCGRDILVERSFEAYGKDILAGLNDVTHNFYDMQAEPVIMLNHSGEPLIRLVFSSAKYERLSHEPVILSVDFKKKNGRYVKSRFGNGFEPEDIHYSPAIDQGHIYEGYIRNRNRSRYKDIVNLALDVMLTFGPGYYQPNETYDIFENIEKGTYSYVTQSVLGERRYYTIFFHSKKKTRFKTHNLVTSVAIWKDTREVCYVIFGNEEMISFDEISFEKQKRNKKHPIVPFEVDYERTRRLMKQKACK